MPDFYLTADDYGLCGQVSEAIINLHDKGVVDRAAVMVNTDGFDEGLQALLSRPNLSLGIHLNLTDGKPVLPASEIKTLVGADGAFFGGRHYAVLFKILSGVISTDEIYREWDAQILKTKNAGLKISHLTSHGHLHLLPPLNSVVVGLLKKHKIPCVRLIFSGDSVKARIFSFFSELLLKKIRKEGLDAVYPLQILGIDFQGHLNRGKILKELSRAKDYPVEFVTHPATGRNIYHDAWGYDGLAEYQALASVDVKREIQALKANE